MKILELEAQNIQRLKAVRLELKGGNLVVVGGNNGQGKTSLLDCLQGVFDKKHISEMPVRKGMEKGSVRIRTEEFTLIQTIKADGSEKVELRPAEGFPEETVAQLRKRLQSKLLDPLEFATMKQAEQVEVLKSLISFDFSAHEKFRKSTYDERTFVNRDLKQKEAENEANPWDPSAPIDEVTFDPTVISEIVKKQSAYLALKGNVEKGLAQLNEIDAQVAELLDRKKRITEWLSANQPKLNEFGNTDAELQLATSQQEMVNQTNARIRKNAEAKKVFEAKKALEAKSNELTRKLEELDAQKIAAIETASLPVAGLSFSEDSGVLFGGIPFAQLSGAERLKVSLAMGIALNPTLRVMLIRDGSLLDEENLRVVASLAEQHDMQVWIERVGKGEECSIIIEDGEVVDNRMGQFPLGIAIGMETT